LLEAQQTLSQNTFVQHALNSFPIKIYQKLSIRKAKLYTNGANRGGLKEPCLEILSLVCHCEYYFKAHKNFILRNENTEFVQRLIEDIQILFPDCCNVKQKIVKHFFTVRSYCLKNYSENINKRKIAYGTATAKRRKC